MVKLSVKHKKVETPTRGDASQRSQQRTPQQTRNANDRRSSVSGTPRMMPCRTPQSGHRYRSQRRFIADMQRMRAVRAYKKIQRQEKIEAAKAGKSSQRTHAAEDSSDDDALNLSTSTLNTPVPSAATGWKGVIEPPLTSTKPLQPSKAPQLHHLKRPSVQLCDQPDRQPPTSPGDVSPSANVKKTSPPPHHRSQSSRRKEYREHSKRTGTGQPLMATKLKSVLQKLKPT